MGATHTPAQRSLRAKIAAHASWARTSDRASRTAAARQAATDRFERRVDSDGLRPLGERARRADSAPRAHMLSLAAKSVAARRKNCTM